MARELIIDTAFARKCQLSILYIYSSFYYICTNHRNLEGIALFFLQNVGKSLKMFTLKYKLLE